MNCQPEFKDPFAPSSANSQPFNSTPLNGAWGSMGGVAPNQVSFFLMILAKSRNDSTLTTSVGQLLALQTHQHIQSTNSGLPNGQVGGNQNHNQQQQDLAPNQPLSHASVAAWHVGPRIAQLSGPEGTPYSYAESTYAHLVCRQP
jgi:hypothetical protein